MTSYTIERASPTLVNRLIECPYSVRLGHLAPGAGGPSAAPGAVLGTVAHEVLANLLRVRPRPEELHTAFERYWTTRLEVHAARTTGSDPRRWPRYTTVKRGTVRVARRLLDELEPLPGPVHVEKELEAVDGWLHGTPDLIIQRADGAEVVDFKTGSLDGVKPPEGYLNQVLLYAYLVSECLGLVATTVRLEPVEGVTWRAAVSPFEIAAAVERARTAVHLYNESATTTAMANVGAACQRCPVASGCEALWESTPTPEGFVGVTGVVERIERSGDAFAAVLATSPGSSAVVALVPATLLSVGANVRLAHLRRRGEAFVWDAGRSRVQADPTP